MGRQARSDQRIEQRRVIVEAEIDNPYLTAGQVEGNEKGENQATRTIGALVNLELVVGGFAQVDDRTEEQTAAVAMFRLAWLVLSSADSGGGSGLGLGVAGAGDVEDLRMARRVDATRRYRQAQKALGMIGARLMEQVACEGVSVREAARAFEGGDGGAARDRIKRRLLEAADVLASEVFGTVAGAGARRRVRFMGDRPDVVGEAGYATVREPDPGR